MTAPKIEYGDTGKVAREKINSIIDEVNASIPSIGENGHWYIGGVDTGIPAAGLILRATDNLIHQNTDLETYVDLQFGEGLTPTSPFPIGLTVGNITEQSGRPQDGILINARTETSYYRILYGDNGELYFDGGGGTFKRIATTDYVDTALNNLRGELHQVAFSGKSSDLDNDYGFSAVPLMTMEQYEETPGTGGDDKEYFIYDVQQ